MLKTFEIQNFQSHKKTKIEFDPGVNVILGTSDSGKSAVFRSILWPCFNRPLGDQFRSWWGGDTIVKMEVDENTITRKKTKKENSYTINDSVTLKAVRSGVPDEVSNILKIDRKINVQAQADPFFLLSPSDSPGKVAEQFNKIANLDLIDESRKKINAMELDETRTIKILKEEIEEGEGKLINFDWIPGIEKRVSRLDVLDAKRAKEEDSLSAIKELIVSIESAEFTIEEQRPYLLLKPELETVNGLIMGISQKKKEKNIIQNIIYSINEQKDKIKNKDAVLRAKTSLANLDTLINKMNKLNKDKDNLISTVNKLKIAENKLVEEKERALQLREELNDNMPEICPLCGK